MGALYPPNPGTCCTILKRWCNKCGYNRRSELRIVFRPPKPLIRSPVLHLTSVSIGVNWKLVRSRRMPPFQFDVPLTKMDMIVKLGMAVLFLFTFLRCGSTCLIIVNVQNICFFSTVFDVFCARFMGGYF